MPELPLSLPSSLLSVRLPAAVWNLKRVTQDHEVRTARYQLLNSLLETMQHYVPSFGNSAHVLGAFLVAIPLSRKWICSCRAILVVISGCFARRLLSADFGGVLSLLGVDVIDRRPWDKLLYKPEFFALLNLLSIPFYSTLPPTLQSIAKLEHANLNVSISRAHPLIF